MKAMIFAGTSEGRALSGFCKNKNIEAHIYVATEYGESLVEASGSIKVFTKRLDALEIEAVIKAENYDVVMDATHPYAIEVTSNIKEACNKTNISYLRVLRKSLEVENESSIYVESIEEAIIYLQDKTGKVLVTTGSKELAKYKEVGDLERLYVRVLPTENVIKECSEVGIIPKNIICMQGPFSEELNYGMLRQIKASYLVTKESGQAGGFIEKIVACQKANVIPIIIGRPIIEKGISVLDAQNYLLEKVVLEAEDTVEVKNNIETENSIKKKPRITILGIGLGTQDLLTLEGKRAIESADAFIGANRMVDITKQYNKPTFTAYKPEEVLNIIELNKEYSNIAILMSGDIGFYSGTKRLLEVLKEYQVETIVGISSLVYFCGKIKESWDDIILSSLHGKQINIIDKIKKNRKVFALTSSGKDIKELCEDLIDQGLTHVKLYVGENLAYESETIHMGNPMELKNISFEKLCVVVIINEQSQNYSYPFGIEEDKFIRGKVPMTKEEVRCISMAKLKLNKDSVVYDIGAGTGSVSIEAALAVEDGRVYAIEKKPEAIGLIEENKRKFGVHNLEIVEGLAPEALEELPLPTHAFIGGTSGNMKQIVDLLLEKNENIRIVINAIALESIAEAIEIGKKYHADITQVTIAKGKEVGNYHMLIGQNPVTIVAFRGGADK